MPRLWISLAAAGTAFIAAAPAFAQYMPIRPGYGYAPQGQAYGNGYGYSRYGQVRVLQARIDSIQHSIDHLTRSHRIDSHSASHLRSESRQIEQRLRYTGANGLNRHESNDIERRIAGLEQRVSYAMKQRFGRGWGYSGYDNGYGNAYREGNYNYRDDPRDRDDQDDYGDRDD